VGTHSYKTCLKTFLHALTLALLVVAGKAAAAGTPAAQGPQPLASADSMVATHPSPVDVHGVVRDANGSPIRGATIRLMSETDTVRVRSDESGKFHARLTATRGVYLLVQAYGFRDLFRAFRASGRPIDAALALPPPYPLGGVAVTLREGPRTATFVILETIRQLTLTS
jgi:hypothetical protein